MRQILCLCLALVLCAAFSGCGTRHESSRTPVVIIGLDTFRGDFFGRKDVQTPNLDALAADGVNFTNCRSTSPWTGPSFASIFTGRLPYRHGFLGGRYLRLADENVTVAEYLQDEGHPTAAFVTIGWLTGSFGMAQGYGAGAKIPDEGDGKASPEVIKQGLAFAGEHRNNPFYLFLHFFDAHAPYTPPAPFDGMYYSGVKDAPGDPLVDFLKSERNQVLNANNKETMYDWLAGVTDFQYPYAQYAAGISYVDHMVGEAIAGLKELGIYDEALIVVVGDHGEHLGEHQLFYTHSMPFDEALQVPLVIKWPAGTHAGTVVTTPVSTIDVLPTILGITGRRARADMDGVDLVPLATDPAAVGRSIIVAEEGPESDRFVKTIVEGSWKLMVYWIDGKRTPSLFDLNGDPGETADVAAQHPEVVERLLARLGTIIDLDRPHTSAPALAPVGQSAETLKRLRSLGYVQ